MKIKRILQGFSLIAFAAGTLHAATMPDFTYNDSKGNPVHLYEYLDSGKYVLIDFTASW